MSLISFTLDLSSSSSGSSLPSPSHEPNKVTYTWVIDNFSSKQSVMVSPCFHMSNSEQKSTGFNLQFYPRGISSFWNEKQMILYLWLDTCEHADSVKVISTVSILNADGIRCHVQEGRAEFNDIHKLKTMQSNWLYMLSREYILNEDNRLITNDQLTIQCEVQLMNFDFEESAFVDNRFKILDDFQSLLDSGTFADTQIVVSGTTTQSAASTSEDNNNINEAANECTTQINRKEFSVHKAILAARSPVFAAMFQHENSKESLENRVDIPDIDVDVFEEMLRFIYTGKVAKIEPLASELMIAADKYQLDSLKCICEQYLCSSISTETAANLLLLADRHNVTKLKARCVDFISRNATKVKDTDGWKRMTKLRPELAIELFLHLASIKG